MTERTHELTAASAALTVRSPNGILTIRPGKHDHAEMIPLDEQPAGSGEMLLSEREVLALVEPCKRHVERSPPRTSGSPLDRAKATL